MLLKMHFPKDCNRLSFAENSIKFKQRKRFNQKMAKIDLSKYGITEFCSSAKYFQGNRSPIDAEKEETGYSLAWQHHKGHNPHHWEYWIDNIDRKSVV